MCALLSRPRGIDSAYERLGIAVPYGSRRNLQYGRTQLSCSGLGSRPATVFAIGSRPGGDAPSGRLVATKHPAAGLKMPAGRPRKWAHSSAFPPFVRVRDELAKCSRAKCSLPQYPARKSERIRVSSPLPPHGAPAPG